MKKRGSALILTLCVITLLTVLTLILVREATATYILTIANEKNDKLNNMAESGIEKGLSALKQKIYNTPDIFTSNISLASTNFQFSEDNITTSVSFQDITDYIDTNNIHKGQAIKITSQAVNSSNNSKKTMSATILKSDISNAYYDAIFNNVISALDTVKGNTDKSFNMQNNLNPLILDGSMYLQGGEINVNPYSLNYASGMININSNSLVTNSSNTSLIDKMYVNPATTVSSDIKNKVKKLSPSLLPILKIKYTTPADSQLNDFYSGSRYTNDNPAYIVKACKQTSLDENGNVQTTLVTFKIIKKNPSDTTSVFYWSDFVRDVKDYIMRNMLGVTGTPSGSSYGNYYENQYRGMYKLYIIDGDVNIQTPSTVSGYINHVIYCTGKCSLARGDNPFLKFEDCSIMAKQVVVNDLRTSSGWYNSTTTYNNLELHGIKKLDAEISDGELSPFSAGNRANINKFLIQHLDGYADALRFKVYKWDES